MWLTVGGGREEGRDHNSWREGGREGDREIEKGGEGGMKEKVMQDVRACIHVYTMYT